MYSTRSGFVLGFHGCSKSVRDKVVSGKLNLNASSNDYDWLGHGIYFWENSPSRAAEFAQSRKNKPRRSKPPIKKPSVLGAIIDLGYCFDLIEYESLKLLKSGYSILKNTSEMSGIKLPENKSIRGQKLIRKLDCAVIETIHKVKSASRERPFDSVRGVFFEDEDLYPSAGFKEKNHIQICIRNPNCIKGYFIPRDKDANWIIP